MHHNYQQHILPCLHCHPHSYIRMVHHLIERCLLLHMTRDHCVRVLAEHASIRPLVTITVWRELQKENRDFFQAYFRSVSSRGFPNLLEGSQDWEDENNGNKMEDPITFSKSLDVKN